MIPLEVISVPKMCIPKGSKLVEAYLTDTEVVVCGEAPYDEDLPEEEQHNCDEMGCGSIGPHVLYRFRLEDAYANGVPAISEEIETEGGE